MGIHLFAIESSCAWHRDRDYRSGGSRGRAKLAGAGNGGTIIALWPWPDATQLEEALHEAGASAIYRLKVAPGAMIEKDDNQPMEIGHG